MDESTEAIAEGTMMEGVDRGAASLGLGSCGYGGSFRAVGRRPSPPPSGFRFRRIRVMLARSAWLPAWIVLAAGLALLFSAGPARAQEDTRAPELLSFSSHTVVARRCICT